MLSASLGRRSSWTGAAPLGAMPPSSGAVVPIRPTIASAAPTVMAGREESVGPSRRRRSRRGPHRHGREQAKRAVRGEIRKLGERGTKRTELVHELGAAGAGGDVGRQPRRRRLHRCRARPAPTGAHRQGWFGISMLSLQTPSSGEQFPVLGEQLPQPQPAAVDARLDRSERGAGHGGHLVVVHAIDVAQHDGGSLVLRQAAKRDLEMPIHLALRRPRQAG